MITNSNKAIEYLSSNTKGTENELNKIIDKSLISIFENSGFLKIKDGNYGFTQKGMDYYSTHVYQNKEKGRGLLGIIPKFRMIFD